MKTYASICKKLGEANYLNGVIREMGPAYAAIVDRANERNWATLNAAKWGVAA